MGPEGRGRRRRGSRGGAPAPEGGQKGAAEGSGTFRQLSGWGVLLDAAEMSPLTLDFSYSWHLEDTLRVDRSLSYLPSLYLTFPLRPAPETARTGAPAQRPPTRSDALAGRNPVGIEVGQPLLDAPQCEVQSGRIAVTRVSCHSVSRQPQALPPCAQIGRGRRPRVGDG